MLAHCLYLRMPFNLLTLLSFSYSCISWYASIALHQFISKRFQNKKWIVPLILLFFRYWSLYLLMYVCILLRWIACRMMKVRWSELSALLRSIGSNPFSFMDARIGSTGRARSKTTRRWMQMDATSLVITGNDWCSWPFSPFSPLLRYSFQYSIGVYQYVGTTLTIRCVGEVYFQHLISIMICSIIQTLYIISKSIKYFSLMHS